MESKEVTVIQIITVSSINSINIINNFVCSLKRHADDYGTKIIMENKTGIIMNKNESKEMINTKTMIMGK